ncbi:MAG: hypothetical protein ACOX5Y_00220 [Acholeplasmataceae bacterium]|jgi:hypothetical protein
MKKNRCYPKYTYLVFYIISTILLIFSAGPIFIKTNEGLFIKILWSSSMIVLAIIMILGALIYMQTYEIDGDKITIQHIFGKIEEIKIEDVFAEIVYLDTYFSWTTSIPKKWICLYDKNQYIKKFKFGCSNKKNSHRIQIYYTENNYNKLRKTKIEFVTNTSFVIKHK